MTERRALSPPAWFPMARCVAFLRAINVGGHTVKMDGLRKLFEEIGLANVETFIASGNVIFDASTKNYRSLEKKIETRLHQSLGYEVATFIRTASELAKIAEHRPFPANITAAGGDLYIGFLASKPAAAAQEKVSALASDLNRFHFSGLELYWLCRARFSESGISGATIERALRMATTIRNANTIHRIVSRYG